MASASAVAWKSEVGLGWPVWWEEENEKRRWSRERKKRMNEKLRQFSNFN